MNDQYLTFILIDGFQFTITRSERTYRMSCDLYVTEELFSQLFQSDYGRVKDGRRFSHLDIKEKDGDDSVAPQEHLIYEGNLSAGQPQRKPTIDTKTICNLIGHTRERTFISQLIYTQLIT